MAFTKLTREACLKLRRLYAENDLTMKALSTRYQVSQDTIGRIIRGEHPLVLDLPNISRAKPKR